MKTTMIKKVIHGLYNRTIRSYLPRKIASFNGVPVRQPRLFDVTDVRPDYEGALVNGIRTQVKEGDKVVIVGGGWGVSTVVSAQKSGLSGSVITYEGGRTEVKRVKETVELSRVDTRVTIVHATVGDQIRVYSETSKAVSPRDLPECDVLVLDCEGAETSILDKMNIQPEKIIVETHPMFGAPADEIRKQLALKEYNIVRERVEQTSYGDLPVLTGLKE